MLKLPAVVKSASPASVKLLFAALLAKPARALALLVEFSIFAAVPVSVMLAALFTMSAPGNCKMPVTL